MTNPVTHLLTVRRAKLAAGITLAVLLSACSSTQEQVYVDAIDDDCLQQAKAMSAHAETSQSPAQLLSSANAMQHCIANPLPANLDNAEREQVMQVMATTVLTYLKAGESDAANAQLRRFETQFPGEDLYLPDYTSFRDTAVTLLGGSHLSTQELAGLNISRELRQEIERQQYWLTH